MSHPTTHRIRAGVGRWWRDRRQSRSLFCWRWLILGWALLAVFERTWHI
jgi:hypothetical protein